VTVFVALLRAVNVGGTGMLPMKDLRGLCEELGCEKVRTYIQSGNVVCESGISEAALRKKLEAALTDKTGREVSVLIRTASELRAALDANPYPHAALARVAVVFLHKAAPSDLLTGLVIPGREEVRAVGREIFVHYPDGMGRSKLKLPPLATQGTARNLNTVGRLAAMAEG
jgi:uncharacterized protein (DUF1697 family)